MQNKHISIIITYISNNRYHAQFDVVEELLDMTLRN